MNSRIFKRNKDKKQVLATVCSHFVVLFILIFFPEIVMSISDVHRTDIPTHVYVKSLMYLAVFYINYYFIIDRCFKGNNSKTKFALYNAVLFVVVLMVCYIMWESEPAHHHPIVHHGHEPGMHPLPPPDGHVHPSDLESGSLQELAHHIIRYVRDAVMVILVMFLALALKLRNRWEQLRHYNEQLMASQREEELKNLKSQLKPHFLFNTLNSIYALIAVNQEKAQWAVHELSGMLRYVLYENPPTVPLKHEVKFVNSYIALMRMRLSGRVSMKISMDIDEKMEDAEVAPLMFITIIENVFKHGVKGYNDKPIEISLSAHDGVVKCYTSNSFNARKSVHEPAGVGLKNLLRRLNLIYGKNAELKVETTDDTFIVELVVNLKTV